MSRSRLGLALGLASLAALAVVVWRSGRWVEALARVDVGDLLGISAAFLATHWLQGEMLRGCLAGVGERLGRGEAVWLTFARAWASLFVPGAGLGVLAVHLERRRGVPWTDVMAFSTLAALATVVVAAAAPLPFLGALPLADPRLTLFCGLGLVAGAVVPLYLVARAPRRPPTTESGWRAVAQRTRAAAERMLGSWRPRLVLGGLSVMLFALRSLRTLLVFTAVGAPIAVPVAVFVTALADLATAINLTPNGLGVREAALTAGTAALGASGGLALEAALLDRAIFTLWIAALGQLALWRLRGRQAA